MVWVQLPHQKKIQKSNPHRDFGSVQQSHPENKVTGIAKAVKWQHKPWCMVQSGVNTAVVCLLKDNKQLSFEQQDNKWLSFEQKDNKWLPFEQVRKKINILQN